MGSSLSCSSSSPSSCSSSYSSHSHSVPGSFDQPRNWQQGQGSGAQNQGESSGNQMTTTFKDPPTYQRDFQPQQQQQQPQQQPEPVPSTADRPPRYSGGYTGAPMAYVDSRYDYGMRMCLRGQHDYRTEYGLAGILCAIFCFPCGLLGLCIDVERICRRCGARQL